MSRQNFKLTHAALELMPTNPTSNIPMLTEEASRTLRNAVVRLCVEATDPTQLQPARVVRTFLGDCLAPWGTRDFDEAGAAIKQAEARLAPIPPVELNGCYQVESRCQGGGWTTLGGQLGGQSYEDAVRLLRAQPHGTHGDRSYRVIAVVRHPLS